MVLQQNAAAFKLAPFVAVGTPGGVFGFGDQAAESLRAVGDFAQLCPGVSVSGGCEIGEGALLGSNACTIPLKNVGAWATVGAGCCVLRDVDGGATLARIR